jgi:7-dehydrocholesterol reductase
VVACWCAFQWALLRLLPGGEYRGPVTASGASPVYKKNGLAAWAVTHALLIAGFYSGVLSPTALYDHYGEVLATLALLVFPLCAGLYLKGIHAPNSPDRTITGYRVFDYFQGVELHPTAFGTSLKQLVNSRISMMGWSAIAVALCAYQMSTPAGLSSASRRRSRRSPVPFFCGRRLLPSSTMHDRFATKICGVLAGENSSAQSPAASPRR